MNIKIWLERKYHSYTSGQDVQFDIGELSSTYYLTTASTDNTTVLREYLRLDHPHTVVKE